MRYHNITKDDMLNGEGLRAVLWVAGCEHGCPGCHNPVTWDICGGLPFDEAAREELFEALGRDYIAGLTLSGGDPLHPANREEIGRLASEVRQRFPEKTIWLYTGYRWEEIEGLALLKNVDVVVDGEFILAQKAKNLHWRGSANQRVIDVQPSLRSGVAVLYKEH